MDKARSPASKWHTMCLCALLATVPAALQASPVQVFECNGPGNGPWPYEHVDSRYIVRRHVEQVPPFETTQNDFWGQGKFTGNGYFEVTIFPFEGEPVRQRSISTLTTVQDGYVSLGDVLVDRATSIDKTVAFEGYTLESVDIILKKQDGTQIDTHLKVPDQLVREEWDPYPACIPQVPCPPECVITWRVPGDGLPCAIGQTGGGTGLCTTGEVRGRILSIGYEEHDEDHSSFTINAGLNDAWVTAQAPFQGLFVTVYEDLGLVFVAWFTFEAPAQQAVTTTQSLQSGLPAVFGAEDQRWVTAVGAYSGDQASLNLELTTGGLFNASAPLPTQDTDYGTLELEFSDCSNGTVTFDVPSAELTGSFPITRVLEENAALCQSLAES